MQLIEYIFARERHSLEEMCVCNGVQQHHWRFGNMEPVGGLTDDDIVALTAYVREQQRLQGFEPYPP